MTAITTRTPTDESLATAAKAALDRGALVYDSDGTTILGAVYHDAGTRRWYAADYADLVELGTAIAAGTPDAYSLWCADTIAAEYETEEEAAASLRCRATA